MCGITGFINPASGDNSEALINRVRAMAETMIARGPDDSGSWCDVAAGVALGHRRLSVIDLSSAGHQPMASACERYIISYNGEIYNFTEIRSELEAVGKIFRGHSDTEVIIEGISYWGVEGTLGRINGMFAFALWDRKEREIILARDRIGIKPLYWAHNEDLFVFGSELKAIMAHGGIKKAVDRNSLATFMRYSYVLAPHTIYQDVNQLEPGTFLTYRHGAKPSITSYWSLRDVALNGCASPFNGSESEAEDALDDLLRDAVKRQMVSDVPLGAFLSGGIDSSLVAALMQTQSDKPIRTFSIGFSDEGFNEAPYAKAVADHLGTDHTELYVDPAMAMDTIPQLAHFYDEPFADSSQIPTMLLSKLTRDSVTVSLSGDGGDELFAGYTRYFNALAAMQGKGFASNKSEIVIRALSVLPRSFLNKMFRVLPKPFYRSNGGDIIHSIASKPISGEIAGEASYLRSLSHWDHPDSIVLGGKERVDVLRNPVTKNEFPDLLDRMKYVDAVQYLPNDILTKVDRASMAASLEARVPLLDHRLIEFAWQLPKNLLIQGNNGKYLLRQVLSRYVPNELFDRPKMGFGIPIGAWLREGLRDWAEDLLDKKKMKEQGFFDVSRVHYIWSEHIREECNWQYLLWDVLMFQSWHQEWMENN